MPIVLYFVFFWVGIAGITVLVISWYLKRFRTDIAEDQAFTSGRSIVWMFNVYNPENYAEEGKRKLIWLYLVTGLGFVGGMGILFMGA